MKNQYFVSRHQCPACNSSDFRKLYQKPFDAPPIRDYLEVFYSSQGGVEFKYLENATFNLCECMTCGLIFQKEIPNEFVMELLYEKWIDAEKDFLRHQNTVNVNPHTHCAREISIIVAYLNQSASDLCFFDFGLGWGKWALMAKKFGCKSFGIELSRKKIKHAKSKGIKIIAWEDIPEHRFDFINTDHVFEHISKPLDTLVHLKSALKSYGIIKISVPTANNIKNRLKIMDWKAPKGTKTSLNPVAPLEHVNYFPRNSIKRMADLAGLEEVSIPILTQYKHTNDWSGAKVIARNILLPLYQNILKRQNYLFFRNRSIIG